MLNSLLRTSPASHYIEIYIGEAFCCTVMSDAKFVTLGSEKDRAQISIREFRV
ncbi:hypothetical protein D3C78_1832600 [compost metagenome]